MRCYCGKEIAEGDRAITLAYWVDWGEKDIRADAAPKTFQAHSFACIGQWAADRAAAHDNTFLQDNEERLAEEEAPSVDTTTVGRIP